MDTNLITKLKPWVTTFSEAIRYQCHHKDSLTVGGKITNIFNLPEMVEDQEEAVQITIDDTVGEILLMIPGKIYSELCTEYSFKDGMIVLAEGKLLDPDGDLSKPTKPGKSMKYIKLNKYKEIEPLPCATLICWNLKPYNEEGTCKETVEES